MIFVEESMVAVVVVTVVVVAVVDTGTGTGGITIINMASIRTVS